MSVLKNTVNTDKNGIVNTVSIDSLTNTLSAPYNTRRTSTLAQPNLNILKVIVPIETHSRESDRNEYVTDLMVKHVCEVETYKHFV